MKEYKPLVSVCCITYNHAKYIKECLGGFLMQKVEFNVEFIIHDDASTDNTQQIIKELVGDDSRFKLILRETNIKSTGVAVFPILYQKAQGKYIALCEGDDYWTDPYKLQKQVNFLEKNEEISICVHNVKQLNLDQTYKNFVPTNYKDGIFDLHHFLNNDNGIEFHTSSFIFRKSSYDAEIYKYGAGLGGDFLLLISLLKKGKIFYMNESMSIYRKHSGGLTSSKSNPDKEFSYYNRLKEFSLSLKIYFENNTYYNAIIDDFVKGLDFYLAEINYKKKNHSEVKKLLSNALFWRLKTFQERKIYTIATLFTYSYLPKIYELVKN